MKGPPTEGAGVAALAATAAGEGIATACPEMLVAVASAGRKKASPPIAALSTIPVTKIAAVWRPFIRPADALARRPFGRVDPAIRWG